MNDAAGYVGERTVDSSTTDFNAISFVVAQMLNGLATAALVQVTAVTNAGEVVPVGFVDAHVLVNQVDGLGNAVPHGIIHHLPYHRLQGGANAVIIDPQVGDIGVAVFAHRDISSVKATRGRANPGSRRKFNWSDGLYLGGFLNGTPTQYIRYYAGGIDIVSPGKVRIDGDTVEIVARTTYRRDVHGYADEFKWVGGTTWEQRTWYIGATINSFTFSIDPPMHFPQT
jgi:hypothetical protein